MIGTGQDEGHNLFASKEHHVSPAADSSECSLFRSFYSSILSFLQDWQAISFIKDNIMMAKKSCNEELEIQGYPKSLWIPVLQDQLSSRVPDSGLVCNLRGRAAEGDQKGTWRKERPDHETCDERWRERRPSRNRHNWHNNERAWGWDSCCISC